jgi:hypothetical protein
MWQQLSHSLNARSLSLSVLFAACSICSFINLIQNVNELLSFRYVISPVLVTPTSVQLPTVSICVSSYINEQKLANLHPHLHSKLVSRGLNSHTGRRFLAKHLSIGQLNQVSYNLTEIFTQCTILDGRMRPQNCRHFSQVKQWLSFDLKCFQFFRPELLPQNASAYEYRLDELASLMWIVIRMNRSMLFAENVGLLLAAGRSDSPQPFLTNPAYALLPTNVLYTVTMAYVKVVTRRLAAPYESDCLHYEGHTSQWNCTLDCVARLMREQNNFWPGIVLTDQLQPDNILHFSVSAELSQNLQWCARHTCRHLDCLSEQYLLFSKYAKYSYQSQSNFTIRIIYNYAPEQHVLYQPMFDLSELFSLISFLFSPISFWLGLAFLNIAIWSLTCFEKKHRSWFKMFTQYF